VKKILCIIIVIITVGTPFFAQSDSISTSHTKSLPKLQLANFYDILKAERFTTTMWQLMIEQQDPKYPIKSSTDVIEDFNKLLLKEKPSLSWSLDILIGRDETMLFEKYANNIEKLIKRIVFVDGEKVKYLYNREGDIPIRFVLKDEKKVFLLTKYGSSKIFNTLRMSAKNRAAKIISSIILPCMENFHSAFKDSDISYYGMVVFFGSKDFSEEDDVLNLKPEIVSMIISTEQYKKYCEGTITDDDLIDSADVYSTDRCFAYCIPKKIKIRLD
jgi:hypothetical protein